MPRPKQLSFLQNESSAYGGELLRTRAGRRHGRPLDTRSTMHLVVRSSKARGQWSFRHHDARIRSIVDRFSRKYGIRVLSMANVGNHLHFQLKLSSRHTYRPFIRGLTSAIAMAVTGWSRWNPPPARARFWDYRPFTRVVAGRRGYLTLRDYVRINQLEGRGVLRARARWIVERGRSQSLGPPQRKSS
jgi:REP element-mobilizing transposase RayT